MKRKISPDREITLPVSLANGDSHHDLLFAPEKHEGWTHVYKVGDAGYVAGNIYNTKEEALKHPIASKVSTVKIEWEEE